jgi:uncharacterized protein
MVVTSTIFEESKSSECSSDGAWRLCTCRKTFVSFAQQSEIIMSKPIMVATAAVAELEPSPITPSWILSGTPEARNKMLASSHDRAAHIMVWECTPGHFNWDYSEDETIVVISGEVFITDNNDQERRLGPGDVAFFPAGSSCKWRITSKLRKVAVLRQPLPMPLALSLRIWNKLFQIAGMRGTIATVGAVRVANTLVSEVALKAPVGTLGCISF